MKKFILAAMLLTLVGCDSYEKVCMGGVAYWRNIWDGHLAVVYKSDSTVQTCKVL